MDIARALEWSKHRRWHERYDSRTASMRATDARPPRSLVRDARRRGPVAVGLSEFLCGALRHAYGKNIIAGDAKRAHLRAARCADLPAYVPNAADCSHAELAYHYDEVVTSRETMLPLAVSMAAVYWPARCRWRSGDAEDLATRRLRLSIGTSAFVLATILLFGIAL